jgi:hypothetical protein
MHGYRRLKGTKLWQSAFVTRNPDFTARSLGTSSSCRDLILVTAMGVVAPPPFNH